ncbi:hypothetical protein BDD12DRAFT_893730 [Trichophaea hybrida]|nr:hypothetical protein BDD12DRAFT_893730 [Trichophaea hybrida]
MSLPLNGSSDGELSIKGIETSVLMNTITEWKTQELAQTEIPEDTFESSNSSSSGSSNEELDMFIPTAIFLSLPSITRSAVATWKSQRTAVPTRTPGIIHGNLVSMVSIQEQPIPSSGQRGRPRASSRPSDRYLRSLDHNDARPETSTSSATVQMESIMNYNWAIVLEQPL